MLFLITSDNQTYRRTQIQEILSSFDESEVLVYDDTYGKIADLEHYLYPSLFSTAPPVVHLKYMIPSDSEMTTALFLKKLLASPTIFIFEEITVPTPIVTLFKKTGAVVHTETKPVALKKQGDIFFVTGALTGVDKKSRWMVYRKALEEHPIEAILGILYWKVRDLAIKNQKEKTRYLTLYKSLLDAHARAWESGVPLDLLIEKVILTQ